MAITVTGIGRWADTAAASNIGTPLDRAPAANTLVLVAVVFNDAAGTTGPPSSVSGAGIVFSQVTDAVVFNTIASAAHNLSVWRGMSATPDSSRITANYTGTGTHTGAAILVDEIAGVETSGTSGSGAVGSSSISSADGKSSLRLAGPAPAVPTNAWWAVCSSQSSEIPVPNNNFVSSNSTGFLTADTTIVSAYTTLSDGDFAFQASGVDNRGGVIVEIVAAVSGVVDTWAMRQLYQGYHG